MQENPQEEPSYNWPIAYVLVLVVLLVQIGIFYWLTIRWE